jgi:ABC-2 type transport system ATP-binding protein
LHRLFEPLRGLIQVVDDRFRLSPLNGSLRLRDRCDGRGDLFHGLLGPNGAGKTTTLSVLATLIRPDAGRAYVAGHDTVREAARVRALLGLVPQTLAIYPTLTARENLLVFARLFRLHALLLAAHQRRAVPVEAARGEPFDGPCSAGRPGGAPARVIVTMAAVRVEPRA